MNKKTVTKVEYGKVAMIRMPCPKCGDTSLVINGEMACCGAMVDNPEEYKKTKREVEGEKRRYRIGPGRKREIVEKQGNVCFYCGQPFGRPYWHPKRKKIMYSELVFDHFVCWSFSRNSDVKNLVAACSVCNAIKGSKIFANHEDAIAYVKHRAGEKGYDFNVNG